MGSEENAVGIREVARFLGVSEYTAREYAKRGDIPGFRLGDGPRAQWRFFLSDVRAHLTKPKDPWVRQTRLEQRFR